MKTYEVNFTDNISDYSISFLNIKDKNKFIKQLDLSKYTTIKKYNQR